MSVHPNIHIIHLLSSEEFRQYFISSHQSRQTNVAEVHSRHRQAMGAFQCLECCNCTTFHGGRTHFFLKIKTGFKSSGNLWISKSDLYFLDGIQIFLTSANIPPLTYDTLSHSNLKSWDPESNAKKSVCATHRRFYVTLAWVKTQKYK